MSRRALVFGATGFLGRHLTSALVAEGVSVIVACRSEVSARALSEWLVRHDCAELPASVPVDFDAPGLGIAAAVRSAGISEIYNCAGAYRFGMSEDEARQANVDSARAIVELAAGLPGLERLVHVSGYRVGAANAETRWTPEHTRRIYRELGAYEASKVEADAVVQVEANRLGVPWSIVNPSTVSGIAATGESDQYLGLADSFRQLWHGEMAARPGDTDTFVPVIPVDYLARFMTLLPTDPATAGHSYWVLDDETPALPELLRVVGEHYRVRVPRVRIPVAAVKRLPTALTKADPETIGFMSSDRYPTGPADEFAARHGLAIPATVPAIQRWADHLAAHRFGAAEETDLNRRFAEHAGVRTFTLGPENAGNLVLPGLPVNADTWATVAAATADTSVADLPGLGMSSGAPGDWPDWLDALLPGRRHLIGHSIGAAAVVEAANRHPDRIERLTLVAPFFLQPPGGPSTRAGLLTSAFLRRMRPEALSRRLTGTPDHARELAGSVADLRRAGVSRRVAALLRRAAEKRWRAELVRQLTAFAGPVHIVVGTEDPLAPWAVDLLTGFGSRARITTIDGAGHHPQLTHPERLATLIGADAVDRAR
ncbi:alpha/beta fold hydrolase [Nocardia shimofusensis]|uniref:alpha/beta fold hydrolase n=1 Tax=Nocardia shimofusensis TaxID=228596 RepID=UPI00082E9718|nr:alpha/beta fold hydrolase [Nocardia shimofusensis]